jgi:hypothetical protein
MEVTPLIDRIARNTAELSDITFKVAKERIDQRLSFVLQALRNSRISLLREQRKESTNASRLSYKNGTLARLQ